MGLRVWRKKLIIVRTKLKIRAQINPSTLKPGTMFAANKIRSAFKTKVKSPRVRRLMGKVKINSNGFRNALMTPRTIAATKAVVKFSTSTPGKIYAATKTAIPLNNKLITILILG